MKKINILAFCKNKPCPNVYQLGVSMNNQKILIVGGVAGGASAAARLRRLNENAEIIMFEKGEYISFANCGLPYYIGGEIQTKSHLILQTPQSFQERFNVDVRTQSEVIAINQDTKTVTIRNCGNKQEYFEHYDKLILSPGATPILPPMVTATSHRIFTLRNIPDTYKIKDFISQHKPDTAAVVGGGYIGVELAENLHNAGVNVTIIEMQNQVIAPLDFDMACEVHRHIEDKGIKLMLDTLVRGIQETKTGLSIEVDSGKIQVDMLIMAIGVKPETAITRNTNIATNARGAILVNDQMQTTNNDIYAVGDAIEIVDFITGQKGMIPLAGPANKQGRIAADNISGLSSRYDGTQGSAIIKVFDMTVATTGINEKTAKRLSLDYDKAFTYSSSHAGYYPGATNMSIKTIYEKETGKILGAQLVGFEGVDKRCDVLATAIRFGATDQDLTKLELCYAPPFSSAKDPVNMIGYVIGNQRNKQVKIFHWHDVEKLPQDGSVTLLDTRTSSEFAAGHIHGFINIPVDELRMRFDELDRSKPIYVTCQIGLRGYIACKILGGKGYNCYNLSGGFRLYNSIFNNNNEKGV